MEARSAQRERPQFVLLQVLRGIAALLVVCHHATIMTKERLGAGDAVWLNGAAGVDIFFVISGFVMGLSSRGLAGKEAPATIFLKRRIERVVPLYWLATTAKLALILAVPALAVNESGSRWNEVASYMFVPARNSAGMMLPVLVVGWTLNFEMMFYVVFACALAWRVRASRLVFPIMLLLAALSQFISQKSPASFYCNSIVLEFVFGVALYGWYARGASVRPVFGCLALLAGFAVLLLVPEGYASSLRGLIWGVPSLAIVWGAIQLEASVADAMPGWVRELGDGSYSLYLSHGFVLPVAGILLLRLHVRGPSAFWPGIAVAGIACPIVGDVVYRGIERPIIEFFRQRRALAA